MLLYFFQTVGINKTSTVKSSKRPISIYMLNKNFPPSVMAEKLEAGPTAPKPGPTLPKQVAAAEKDSNMSIPVKDNTKPPINTKTKKIKMNQTKQVRWN